MVNIRLGAAALILLALMIASCSNSQSRVGGMLGLNTDLKINFEVADNINPDAQQNPSPLFLRVYELDSPQAFEKADFIDLYERDDALLGSALIARDQLEPFLPGEGRTVNMVLKPGTRYVGIYAEFLQYEDARAKLVIPVTENNVIKNRIDVQIEGNSIWLAEK